MPLILDGNNLLHRLPQSSRSRGEVRRLVLDACRGDRTRITVVFDGPPPAGSPTRESLGAVTVLYSGSASADDLIIRQIPGGPLAREWVVITDDRELRERAKRRGAEVRTLREWQARRESPARRTPSESKLSSHEVADWEAYFSDGPRNNDE
jgi:hypothetical protein